MCNTIHWCASRNQELLITHPIYISYVLSVTCNKLQVTDNNESYILETA